MASNGADTFGGLETVLHLGLGELRVRCGRFRHGH